MTLQQLKQDLWQSYEILENILIESDRTTMEMMQGEALEESLKLALRVIGSCIDLVNCEYFPKCLE